MAHLDWTVDHPKSNLAVALLQLVKMCFKDLRRPDFKEDTYNLVEVIISQLLENLDSPALSKYIQEVLEICNEMIIVKQEVTPILSDILHEMVNVAEV